MSIPWGAIRRARRAAPPRSLARRDDRDLAFVEYPARAGQALLLDTCVYIDQMQGQAPADLEDLISIRLVHHSAVAMQELLHTVGVLDPRDPRTAPVIQTVEAVTNAMPPHRIVVPDLDTLAEAAFLAGLLCRLQGYAHDRRQSALHDAVLFLSALKSGLTVLSRNVRDFDALLQLRPEGRVLFYRRHSAI